MSNNRVSKFLLFLLLSFFFLTADAQIINYARKVVDTLSSPSMHGRGYVKDGHVKAATYIASEFKKFELRSFGNGYFQEFNIKVNTFPANVLFKVNSQNLIAGQDFLIAPCSQSLRGNFEATYLTKDELFSSEKLLNKLTQAKGKVVVIDQAGLEITKKEEQQKLNEVLEFLKHFKNNPTRATILLTNEKLTWHIAQEPCETPQIVVKKSSLQEKVTKTSIHFESKYLNNLITQNVVGFLPGKNPNSNIIAVTAHYDHLGHMGNEAYFPGANDNASGVAMLLSLAKHYSLPKNRPENNMLFIAFGAEEVGLLGSKHFVQNPLVPLDQIKFLINLDINGTGDDGIKVVNGKVFEDKFRILQELNEEHKLLKEVYARGEACNSDHCLFYERGVPSFYIYTLGGVQAYHDIYDKAETLPLTKFEDFFSLLTHFIKVI